MCVCLCVYAFVVCMRLHDDSIAGAKAVADRHVDVMCNIYIYIYII